MQSGIWETVADTLFWLQLGWIFSGFLLMAYLAFKVFPGAPKLGDVREYASALRVDIDRSTVSEDQSQRSFR